MYAGQRLAIALGSIDGSSLREDDDASRKKIIRAGEAMVDAGLAIVVNRPGTKIPMCTLPARDVKKADQEAFDKASAAGDPHAHKRKHACGLAHAITDRATAGRVLTRMVRRGLVNIGVEPRASRVLIVDIDTKGQEADFFLKCGKKRPGMTVRSPGQRDRAGNWVHQHGGHIWFEVPEGLELPIDDGIYTAPAGWSAIWGEHQVLVPPSARAEGAYRLVGAMHELPDWLLELITTESQAKVQRREEARRRRATAGPSQIDDWAESVPWSDILTDDGWTETGLVKNCGCPQWTAPGDHASPESATAHEPGCAVYVCERGHGPLHVWTDHPSDAVAAAIAEYGTRTLTKIQVLTHTEGEGRMGRLLRELGVEDDRGPTIISSPFAKWDQENKEEASQSETPSPDPGPATGSGSGSTDDGADEEDEADEDEDEVEEKLTEEVLRERRIQREFEHELIRKAALERLAAIDAPPLRLMGASEFFQTPDPQQLVPGLFYRDSLSRIIGAPGCGKSFLILGVAMSIALGKRWCDEPIERGSVIYVMAEGQRVNKQRTQAWLSYHHARESDLEGWLYTVPDALRLTEEGVAALAAECARIRPAMVIFDTKNAMMVGEENSGTDAGVMRRALDAVRTSCDACCVLIDHTGKAGGDDGRGSNAVTAMMDTQIKVENHGGTPAAITARVVRDKAAEAGREWAFFLEPEFPAAVLKHTTAAEQEEQAKRSEPAWKTAEGVPVPTDLKHYEGAGAAVMPFLAKFMAHDASPRFGDPNGVGVSRAEAARAMKHVGFEETSVRRAWSALIVDGYIDRAEGCKSDTGRHVWTR
jgi:hypothetical protein